MALLSTIQALSGSFRVFPLRRRLALAAASVLALTGVGTAFAVGTRLGDLDAFFEFFDKEANHPSIPRLIGDRAVVTRGEDWAFVAWKSTRGLCTSLVFSENEGGTNCGIPVAGAPREEGAPEHLIVGGSHQGLPDDDLWLQGVAAANASRVEVELGDGRRLQAPVYDAPAALGLDLKFFLVRTRPPGGWPPKVGIPGAPFRAFSAYDARGRLLERFGPDESVRPATFPLSADDLPHLKSLALEAAARLGDAAPTSGRAYSSSRRVAVDVTSQDRVDSDQPVFVMVLHGDFVVNRGPPDSARPSGPYLTLVWDPATRHVTNFGVKTREPDMTRLGPGLDLDL
jgi:hypothetical protein